MTDSYVWSIVDNVRRTSVSAATIGLWCCLLSCRLLYANCVVTLAHCQLFSTTRTDYVMNHSVRSTIRYFTMAFRVTSYRSALSKSGRQSVAVLRSDRNLQEGERESELSIPSIPTLRHTRRRRQHIPPPTHTRPPSVHCAAYIRSLRILSTARAGSQTQTRARPRHWRDRIRRRPCLSLTDPRALAALPSEREESAP